MDTEIRDLFYRKLDADKIKINWNLNPIRMDIFISFLTIPIKRNEKCFGCDTGWTERTNKDSGLIIKGGIIKGIEYLESIKYGKNLDNPYNDFVNPFYLFEIFTDEGKKFFIEYYKEEINSIYEESHDNYLSSKIIFEKISDEIRSLRENV